MNCSLSDSHRVELECAWAAKRSGQPVHGYTVNLGSEGALLRVDRRPRQDDLPAVGHVLVLHIALPTNPEFGRRCLIVRASVLKIEQDPGGATHIAVAFGRKRFGEWPFKVMVQPPALSELPVLLM